MKKNLTTKEEKRARNLKTKFTDVHAQIQGVQIEIEMMNRRAESLIKELNELREEEIKFIGDLGTKYGPGKLDPFTLIYKIEENEIA